MTTQQSKRPAKFNQIFRWIMIILLSAFTLAILLDRVVWHKIPTQLSGVTVDVVIALNFAAVVALVAVPSALGLSTKTDKN